MSEHPASCEKAATLIRELLEDLECGEIESIELTWFRDSHLSVTFRKYGEMEETKP